MLFSFITLLCVVIALATWVGYGQAKINKQLEEERKVEPEQVPNLGISVSGILAGVVLPVQALTFGMFLYVLRGHGNSTSRQALL